MNSKKLFWFLTTVLAIASFDSVAYADTVTQTQRSSGVITATSQSEKATYLFVIEAKQGKISKAKDGSYTLMISQVDPKTLYFSSEPEYKAGYMKTQNFMNMWIKPGSTFELNPPNAAFVHSAVNGDKSINNTQAVPIELSNPKVLSTGQIIFKVSNVGSQHITPGNVGNVKLFIDGVVNTAGMF